MTTPTAEVATPDAPPTGRLSREFHLLWTGQSVSYFGDRVTLFVVPTVVVFVLGGSAFDVGLISTAQYLAIPLLSLIAGALAAGWDLRRLLVGCDLVRFAAVAVIPIAYWRGFLSLPLLFGCVAVISAATVFFNIGYMPAMASIVAPADLVRGNSRMEASRTVSELGGPAFAGGLYQGLGIAALLVDAASYLFSAGTIRAMRPVGEKSGGGRLLQRTRYGLRRNWGDPVLRRSTLGTLLANIGGPIFVTQLPVLAYQGLHLSAGAFGVVMSIAAAGAVLGAVLAPRVSRRVGPGRMLGLSMVAHSLSGLGLLALPWLPGAPVLTVTLTAYGFFFAWYNINSAAVRQGRTPIRDQAVIHGAYRTLTWGAIPLSSLVGGLVVSWLAGHMPTVDAARYAMTAATLIGVTAIIPLAAMPRLLRAPGPAPSTSDVLSGTVA